MKTRILPHSFFDRPVLEVCKDLLGKFLVIKDGERKTDNGKRAQ
jgi:3-methyladenine DNA glycosylase Mpg